MKQLLRAIVVSLFVMMLGSCQKDPPTADTPTEGGGSDTEEMWPAKKITRIVHSVGTFDYLTYDFSWEGEIRALTTTHKKYITTIPVKIYGALVPRDIRYNP